MSSSGHTVGAAQLDVTASDRVVCTQRVKSVNNRVIWLVRNLTDGDVTVGLQNFRPVAGADKRLRYPPLSIGPLPPGHRGAIRGDFTGRPGDVYDYDVVVNGKTATDPQIEI